MNNVCTRDLKRSTDSETMGARQTRPILITFLSPDMVHADFAYSLSMLLMYSIAQCRMWVGLQNTRCSVIDHGRCVALESLKQSNASHILFLDSDMIFPHQTLERLLSHNLDVVGASYCTRKAPFAMTHLNMDMTSAIPEFNDDFPLKEVHSLGGGCLLIRAEVFDKIPPPHFQSVWPTPNAPQGEDRTFCIRARKAGFKVWCDWPLTMQIGHVGTFTYTPQHADTIVRKEGFQWAD